MTTEHACWVPGAADPRADFPIENLPWGVAERPDRPGEPRIVAAIGDRALDCAEAAGFGMLEGLAPRIVAALRQPTLNAFMALGGADWSAARAHVAAMVGQGGGSIERHAPTWAACSARTSR